MFEAVSRNVFAWRTPDPEGDWYMKGHMIIDRDEIVLVDPPMIPGLIDVLHRMGNVKGIILTTLDHSRGAKYIAEKTETTLFIPDQGVSYWLDPAARRDEKGIEKYEIYGEGEVCGLKAYHLVVQDEKDTGKPWLDEYVLQYGREMLITGDIAIGSTTENLCIAPEWFPADPPHNEYKPAVSAFRSVVEKTGAEKLLAPHGDDIYYGLQNFMKEYGKKVLA